MCRPWNGCDDGASCLSLSLTRDFPKKPVHGIVKKKETKNIPMFVGLASTSSTNEARR